MPDSANIQDMRFEITYVNRRQGKRITDGTRFEKSNAFYPVLQLEVGEVITKRYTTAGIKQIKRIA